MKKITFHFLFLMMISYGYSQATHTIDFEPAGTGSGWTWTAEEAAPDFAEITNPVSGGINTSATVVEFEAHTTDFNWALCHTDANNTFTFDGTNSTVTIMVYKPTISDVAIKFEGTSGNKEIAVANTVTNQWEELTFDFSSEIGKTYNRIVIIPDFVKPYVTGKDRASDNKLYFDNLQVPEGAVVETCDDGIMNNGETDIDCGGPNCDACPEPASPPTTAAPIPPARNASDVVSIYSDAYPIISPINYDEAWCGAGAITGTTAGGNAIIAFNDKACQGIGFASDLQDVTGMTNIHVDLFIQTGTDLVGKVFNMKIVPSSGDETHFNLDLNAVNPAPVPGTWYSYDAQISLTGPTVDIKQFGITSNLNNVVWYDNLYFWKAPLLGTKNTTIEGLKTYPNPTNDVWNISTEKDEINSIEVYNVIGEKMLSTTPNALTVALDTSNLSAGIYIAIINTDSGSTSQKLIKK